MQCPRCDSEIERTASYCPECGLDIDELKEGLQGGEPDGGGSTDRPSAEASAPTSEPDTSSASGARGRDASQSGSSQTDGPFQRASKQSVGASEPQAGGSSGQQSRPDSGRRREQPAQQTRENGGRNPANQQSTRGQRATGSDFSLPIVEGAVYGALAYAVNFAVVFGLFVYEMDERGANLANSQTELYELAGWVFYGGHRVEMTSPFASESVNYLEQMYSGSVSTTVPKLAFYAIPALGLLLAGRAVASRVTSRRATDADKVKAGATVALGYAALAVAGAATVFSVDVSAFGASLAQASGSIKPEMQSAVIFMGIAYPIVAGGLGGYLAD
jgi:hypothetical protein